MKINTLFLLLVFLQCNFILPGQTIYKPEDKNILEDIFRQLQNGRDEPTAKIIFKTGKLLLGTPYVAHTLETDKEQLTINLRGLDCTTFAENCLAIALCIKTGEPTFNTFSQTLKQIRYRKGTIKDYTSRLHYFSDWIYENEQKDIFQQISKDMGNTIYPLQVNFMSTHPGSYQQLKNNQKYIAEIARTEEDINSRVMYYIPENNIAQQKNKMKTGDIVGITTSIKGLDILHAGILVKQNERIHLMHASSTKQKVIISEETLEEYVTNSKYATGIMIVRVQ